MKHNIFSIKSSGLTRQALFLFLVFLGFGSADYKNAAPSDFDPTFGVSGVIKVPNFFPDIRNKSMTVQPDGKLVIIGAFRSSSPFRNDFWVARFNPNGTQDTSFGVNGSVVTTFATPENEPMDVTVQSDGKIVVCGFVGQTIGIPDSFIFEANWALVRYNSNGSLDSSFGNGGKVVTPLITGRANFANAVRIQADGKIAVVGTATENSPSSSRRNIVVLRYNANGQPDTSFGSNGIVNTFIGDSSAARSLVIQTNGKLIVAGNGRAGNSQSLLFTVLRYNSNGNLDTSFGSGGIVQTVFVSSYSSRARSVILQPDGKIVAAGWAVTSNANYSDIAVARYNSDGSPDTSFDEDGKLLTFNQSGNDVADTVALQTNGKLVVGGYTAQSFSIDKHSLVIRYNADGTLDSSFDGDGKFVYPFAVSRDVIFDSIVLPDGKLLLGGHLSGSGGFSEDRMFFARLEGDSAITSSPIIDFDGDGKTDISVFRPSVTEWYFQRSGNGVVNEAAFGNSFDRPTPADYTGDGKTDIAIFRPSSGEWYVLRSEDFSFYAFPFGVATDIAALGDFDGDGKADAAVFRPSTGIWYIQKSTGGVTIQPFGTNNDRPVVADYDGDGKSDIAIFRPSVGEWYYLRSSDSQVRGAQFGSSSDRTVQGDYTGDGKADFAFFRPSTGSWFVLRSENSSFFASPFGIASDTPTPGDYDGDGKFDQAVFRPSNGTWFVNKSNGSGVIIQPFGANTDLPLPSYYLP